jgi:hypothetical protein
MRREDIATERLDRPAEPAPAIVATPPTPTELVESPNVTPLPRGRGESA